MTEFKFFTHDDFFKIPENVGIIFKNYGDLGNGESRSCFAWSVFEFQEVYAGTYFVSHQLPVTKELIEDVTSVLAQQIQTYLQSVKGGEHGQSN